MTAKAMAQNATEINHLNVYIYIKVNYCAICFCSHLLFFTPYLCQVIYTYMCIPGVYMCIYTDFVSPESRYSGAHYSCNIDH